MRHRFIMPRGRLVRAGPTFSSVAAHLVLIGWLLAAPRPASKPVVYEQPHNVERVAYLATPLFYGSMPPEPSPAPAATRRGPERAPRPLIPDLRSLDALQASLRVPIELPPVNPAPDFAGMAAGSISFGIGGNGDASLARTVFGRTDRARMSGDAYLAWVVEKQVRPRRNNPIPRYPEPMRRRSIEGSFIVRFVVDSTGRVLRDDITFPPGMHRLFAESVRDAILRSRYSPAELDGHPVRQLVEQQFIFVMGR